MRSGVNMASTCLRGFLTNIWVRSRWEDRRGGLCGPPRKCPPRPSLTSNHSRMFSTAPPDSVATVLSGNLLSSPRRTGHQSAKSGVLTSTRDEGKCRCSWESARKNALGPPPTKLFLTGSHPVIAFPSHLPTVPFSQQQLNWFTVTRQPYWTGAHPGGVSGLQVHWDGWGFPLFSWAMYHVQHHSWAQPIV